MPSTGWRRSLPTSTPRTTLSWFGLLEALDEHDGEAFRWTALKARRQIGLPALQELGRGDEDHRKMTPLDAVSRVVARLTAVGREGWADRDEREGRGLAVQHRRWRPCRGDPGCGHMGDGVPHAGALAPARHPRPR